MKLTCTAIVVAAANHGIDQQGQARSDREQQCEENNERATSHIINGIEKTVEFFSAWLV